MSNYLVKEITYYCNVALPKCGQISEHVIDYYDFTFMLEGRMTYYANGTKYIMEKNDAIFLKPQTLRSRVAGNEPVRFVSFNFYALNDDLLPFNEYLPKCITSNIRKLIELYPPSHLTTFYHSKEKCTNMLNFILFELLDTDAMKSGNEHVIRILNYIEEHITDKITLQTISAYINLSREYTSYIFKRETGKTLTTYINERKLRLAKELILNEEMSLADLAAHLGYENYNYFSKIFKKYLEITPMELKKR